MSNSDHKKETRGDASRDWRTLCDNVMEAAGRKSKSLMTSPDVDDAAFDCGARSLRALIGAAEIAHRMQRIDKLEKENDEREGSKGGMPKDEFDELYDSVSRQVERAERERADAARQGNNDAHHSEEQAENLREGLE